MRRLGYVSLDGIHFLSLYRVIHMLDLLGEAPDGLVLCNDGFIEGLGELLHVRQ